MPPTAQVSDRSTDGRVHGNQSGDAAKHKTMQHNLTVKHYTTHASGMVCSNCLGYMTLSGFRSMMMSSRFHE